MAQRWGAELAECRREEAMKLLRQHGPLRMPQDGKGMGDAGLLHHIGDGTIGHSTLRALVQRGLVKKVRVSDGLEYRVKT